MVIAARTSHPWPRFAVVGVALLVHAGVVLVLWYVAMYRYIQVVPAGWWLALFWAWLLWVVALLCHPRAALRSAVPLLIGGSVLLSPAVPTAWSFTSWLLAGFAP